MGRRESDPGVEMPLRSRAASSNYPEKLSENMCPTRLSRDHGDLFRRSHGAEGEGMVDVRGSRGQC